MEAILKKTTDPRGIGLAATQVGLDKRLFILLDEKNKKTKVFIALEIVHENLREAFVVEEPKLLKPPQNRQNLRVSKRPGPQLPMEFPRGMEPNGQQFHGFIVNFLI